MTKDELISLGDQTFDQLFNLSQQDSGKEKTNRYCELQKQLREIKKELRDDHNVKM